MNSKDALTRINENYGNFTKSEKKVADYIFSNKDEVQYMTIISLAAGAQVAEATIFRFCLTLDFIGYNDFKISLAKALVNTNVHNISNLASGAITPNDSFEEMCQKLYQVQSLAVDETLAVVTEEQIYKSVDLIEKAKRIFFIGQGGSLVLAMIGWSRFITISNKFHCVQDNHQQAITATLLEPDDVIICVSYSGTTKDTLDILPKAKETGVNVILITGFPLSEAAKYAAVVLHCNAKEGPLQMGSYGSKIAQIYLLELLFNEFYRRNIPEFINNTEATTYAVAKKML